MAPTSRLLQVLLLASVAVVATGALAGAPDAGPAGERVVDALHGDNGAVLFQLVRLADAGAEMRGPEGYVHWMRIAWNDCVADDARFFTAAARGCRTDADCALARPDTNPARCCAAVSRRLYESDAYDRALEAVRRTAKLPDGGACTLAPPPQWCRPACDAVRCVKGVCEPTQMVRPTGGPLIGDFPEPGE